MRRARARSETAIERRVSVESRGVNPRGAATDDAVSAAGRRGVFCEYGSGVAPVTAFLRPRFPEWRYTLVDLPTPTLAFARWRFREHANVEFKEPGFGTDLPLTSPYDVITCLDVLEHV